MPDIACSGPVAGVCPIGHEPIEPGRQAAACWGCAAWARHIRPQRRDYERREAYEPVSESGRPCETMAEYDHRNASELPLVGAEIMDQLFPRIRQASRQAGGGRPK